MKLNTKATGISLTPSISGYLDKKIKMLKKFFPKPEEVLINVEVGKTSERHKSGNIFRAEIQVVCGGETYYAEAKTDDLYAAIDIVKDKISYELSSVKKKNVRKLRQGGAKIKKILRGIKRKK